MLVAASDYMKVLPESIAQWMPRPLVALGTDGFGRSESRVALRDFFEVDAKHIVLATLTALPREKQIKPEVLQKAVKELGINPEKANPANTLDLAQTDLGGRRESIRPRAEGKMAFDTAAALERYKKQIRSDNQ